MPFPSYRYLPGAYPHPVQDPQGHSYVAEHGPEPKVPAVDRERWRESEAYLFGCDLYNHRYWWEAHEAWEGPWRSCQRDPLQGHFLQALIQTSAQALKLRSGNREGVVALGERAAGHMGEVLERLEGERYLGLDVRAWYEDVRAYYEVRLGQAGKPEHEMARFPYLRLGDG
jgi:uncharacterized protein